MEIKKYTSQKKSYATQEHNCTNSLQLISNGTIYFGFAPTCADDQGHFLFKYATNDEATHNGLAF